MDGLHLEINGKNILVRTVNDQKNLHQIILNGLFCGYLDTKGKFTNITNFTQAEVEFVEVNIMEAMK